MKSSIKKASKVFVKVFDWKEDEAAEAWANGMANRGLILMQGQSNGSDTYALYAGPSEKAIRDYCEEDEQDVELSPYEVV